MPTYTLDICDGKTREQLCEDYRRVLRLAHERDQIMKDIWLIIHRPSSEHPKGSHAYTHFMADFDQIRKLIYPIIRPHLDDTN